MRVTADVKQETRRRIIESARKLFADKGFEQTTTRDIVADAGIAAGTLYNYFPTKESLAMTLIIEALDGAAEDFASTRRCDESLEESLFAHVNAGLWRLAPHRRYLAEVLETALSPFAERSPGGEAERLRLGHLETVGQLIAGRAPPGAPAHSALTMHLYWTLYLGVLAFWANDPSPNQEDTRVVLDQSMRLFAAWLTNGGMRTEERCDVPDSC